jgi:hypothetical protein
MMPAMRLLGQIVRLVAAAKRERTQASEHDVRLAAATTRLLYR